MFEFVKKNIFPAEITNCQVWQRYLKYLKSQLQLEDFHYGGFDLELSP